jgi:hypothetical protein
MRPGFNGRAFRVPYGTWPVISAISTKVFFLSRAVRSPSIASHMVKKRGHGCGEIEVIANPDCFRRGIAHAAFGYLAQARSAPPPVLIFVKDPLGTEGLSFNMAIKFQVSED